ncbi:6-phospho-3-hexuloisomerase [Microbacterium ginsengiterrae]|uniref:6-phospho-3-hexuloisomerase n=1 Tax=Microbacterium ginsengiterrae TaxID=546115 RepID=A0A7W9CAB1_9MICO|nr:SIS domain-containing protein [Microbacterium ginsengiterrae]MBB5741954.1 6-phospho-3-hexuloisomerase [Microbacterium ginsengiterrae]
MDSPATPLDTPWLAAGKELTELLAQVDTDQFHAVRTAIQEPERRWFFSGQGRSGLSATMVAMRLMHLGRESHVVGEATCPSVRAGDGIVFFSGSGATPVSLAFARTAKNEGALVVAVTRNAESSLGQIADLVLALPVAGSQQMGGNLFEHGALVVMDSLINAVGVSEGTDPDESLRYWHTNLQ